MNMHSGVTRGLSQVEQKFLEGVPLATVRGQRANTKKKS